MKIIECISEDIEATLNMAEHNIKKAMKYKEEYPVASRAFYNKSVALMDTIKLQHDAAVALIEGYKKEHGEPPVPMMAIYNYLHERQINQAAGIRTLQDMYSK